MACLFNLTTSQEVLSTLVSQGMVEVIVQLWPDLVKDLKMAKLALLSLCHLACGKTNSSRIVSDGVTPLLCFITEHRKQPQFAQYTFTYDYYLRISAALRNLLIVVGNQKQMIDEGVLPVLIQMANQSFDRLIAANNLTTTLGAATPSETKLIRINCAAALKSLTYNKDLRNMLVETEAINIILAEIRKESDLSITQGLLKELEAESWENGARTKQKDGRAKTLPPAPLFTEFLKGNTKVELDFEAKDVELQKYYVKINLDNEPDDYWKNLGGGSLASSPRSLSSQESSAKSDKDRKMSTFRTSSSFRRTKLAKMVTQASLTMANQDENDFSASGIEQLRIEDLKPREDTDDSLALVPMSYGKVEVEVEVDAAQLVRADTADDLQSMTDEEPPNTSPDKNKSLAEGSTSTGRTPGIPEIISISMQKQKSGIHRDSSKRLSGSKSGELPSIKTTKPRTPHRTSEQEEMSHLVLLINKAKGHHGHVDEVLDNWKRISRF
eukprot:gene29851-36041_t